MFLYQSLVLCSLSTAKYSNTNVSANFKVEASYMKSREYDLVSLMSVP